MLWLTLLLLAQAAPAPVEVAPGAAVFARTCAVGYCHGTGGAAGRAPRIQGRTFARDYLRKVVLEGIPSTGMPAWKGKLSDEEVDAVVAFMMSVATPGPSGPAAAPRAIVAAPSDREMPPEARRGRELFFDAGRIARCGTCHLLENRGMAIGPNPASPPPKSASDLRKALPREVGLARLTNGEQFPALLVERKDALVRLYDLTAAPPVLRTVSGAEAAFSKPAAWSHGQAVSDYADAELEAVIAYLQWVAGP
ncbi:MAG: cytochrome c [Bryobacteraceae bacterium]|nr:cytochrome c [Bryobacteraceae bacterium]